MNFLHKFDSKSIISKPIASFKFENDVCNSNWKFSMSIKLNYEDYDLFKKNYSPVDSYINLKIKWATKSINTRIPVPAAKAICFPFWEMLRPSPIGPFILNTWFLIIISSWINLDKQPSFL